MIRAARILTLLSLMLLGACASDESARVVELEARPALTQSRLDELQQSATALRRQYNSLGRSLKKVEEDIAALTGKPAANNARLTSSNAPRTQSSQAPAATTDNIRQPLQMPKPSEPLLPTPQTEATAKPEQATTAPVTLINNNAAKVDELTEQDMAVEPPKPSAQAAATSAAKKFTVHIASYTATEQVGRGWTQLRARYGDALKEQKGYVSQFSDSRNRNWQRLNAGRFDNRAEADRICAAIKAQNSWCEVLSLESNQLKAIN